jgi:D-alanyl-D-alanine carboxypeptidase
MNQKARALGAKRTKFYTPSGLDKKIVRNRKGKKQVHIISNVSTAREIGRIAQVAFSNDTIQTICLKEQYIMASKKLTRGYPIRSTNRLLREDLPLLGGKTGYTSRAGHCLATEFACGKSPLLIVVLGSPNHFRDTKLVYKKARSITRKAKRRMRRSASYPTTRHLYRLGG